MKERINEKINEISDYLLELKDTVPPRFDDYLKSAVTKAACERYFEKIIEAMVDLSFMVIKYKKLTFPEDDNSVFLFLAKEEILSSELALKLRKAKGMRNIIAHEYGKIDNLLVFQAVSSKVRPDTEEFLKEIKKVI